MEIGDVRKAAWNEAIAQVQNMPIGGCGKFVDVEYVRAQLNSLKQK